MRKPAKLVRLRGGSNGFSFSKTPRPLTFLRRKSAALPRRNHSTHRRFRHQPHRDNNNNNKRTTSFASPSGESHASKKKRKKNSVKPKRWLVATKRKSRAQSKSNPTKKINMSSIRLAATTYTVDRTWRRPGSSTKSNETVHENPVKSARLLPETETNDASSITKPKPKLEI